MTEIKENFPANPSRLNPLFAALQLLTVLPIANARLFTLPELGRAVGLYPFVGLILGTLLAGGNMLLALIFPPPVVAALTLLLWLILTGALHLDGFLDACDGLFGGRTPETRLEIMRDERVGAFALAGGVGFLLVKYTALGALADPRAGLVLAPVLARWGMTLAIMFFPSARPTGFGQAVKENTTWRQIALATLITLIVVIGMEGVWGLVWMGGVVGAVWAMATFVMRRIPGLTGDIYGAICEVTEGLVLLALAGGLA